MRRTFGGYLNGESLVSELRVSSEDKSDVDLGRTDWPGILDAQTQFDSIHLRKWTNVEFNLVLFFFFIFLFIFFFFSFFFFLFFFGRPSFPSARAAKEDIHFAFPGL